ncbi:MAG: SGNH/GDSL hydrolase family protein [Alistipes sp.]
MLEQYERMLDIMPGRPRTKVYIQSRFRSSRTGRIISGQNKRIAGFNAVLREMAERRNLPYIDIWSAIQNNGALPEEFTHDGIHLTGPAMPFGSKRCALRRNLHEKSSAAMRFRTTTAARAAPDDGTNDPARPVSKDTSRAAAFGPAVRKPTARISRSNCAAGADPLRGVRGPNLRYTFRRHVQRAVHLLRSRRRGAEHGNRVNRATSDNPGPGNRRLRMGRSESLLAEGGTVRTARHVGVSIEADGRCIGATRRCGPVK